MRTVLILALMIGSAFAGENVVVTSEAYVNSAQAQAQADERLQTMFTLAQKMVGRFESVNGLKLAKTLAKDWREQVDQSRSYNLMYDTLLVKILCDIKDKKKDNKEVSIDSVYAACLLFIKYEEPNMMLPSCLVFIFRDKPDSAKTIKETVEESIKKLDDSTVASTDSSSDF